MDAAALADVVEPEALVAYVAVAVEVAVVR